MADSIDDLFSRSEADPAPVVYADPNLMFRVMTSGLTHMRVDVYTREAEPGQFAHAGVLYFRKEEWEEHSRRLMQAGFLVVDH